MRYPMVICIVAVALSNGICVARKVWMKIFDDVIVLVTNRLCCGGLAGRGF